MDMQQQGDAQMQRYLAVMKRSRDLRKPESQKSIVGYSLICMQNHRRLVVSTPPNVRTYTEHIGIERVTRREDDARQASQFIR